MRRGVVLPEDAGARRRTAATLPAELRVRGGQALASLTERVGLALGRGRASGRPVPRGLVPTLGRDTAAVAAAARAGLTAGPVPGLADVGSTLAVLRRLRPEAESATRARAEGAIDGVFDLLGHERVSFGDPIDWHLDPTSGLRTPLTHWSRIHYLDPATAGDYKLRWEVNRHQHFVTLGQAYAYSRDSRYARAFVTQLAGWMDANPPRLGVNWSSSLEVSYRAISWLWALRLFAEAPELTDEVLVRALGVLQQHARHIARYLSTYYSPNTHLTGEALGLLYLGVALPCFRQAADWRDTGWRILREQLWRQVREDGTYFEQALYYHRYTADIYLHALVLGEASGRARDAAMWARVERLVEFLLHATQPGGTVPLVGDDDGGRLMRLDGLGLRDARPTLATGAALFGRSDMQCAAGTAIEECVWLLGDAGARALAAHAPSAPQGLSRAFPDGGFYVMRDGWGASATWALLDGGPHGSLNCGHAHADALSLELSAGGRLLLADGGTFSYTGEARDEYRQTAAHNTVTVDGESSSLVGGLFHWKHVARTTVHAWETTRDHDFFRASHDGYQRLADPATHLRSVLFVRGRYLLVEDVVEARGQHAMAVHWHFAPGLSLAAGAGSDIRLADPARDGTEVAQLLMVGQGAVDVSTGWRSEAYGARRSAHSCAHRQTGSGTLRTLTVICTGTTRACPLEPGSAGSAAGATVVGAAFQDRIHVRGSAPALHVLGVATDARFVVASAADDGRTARVLLVGASFVEAEGIGRQDVAADAVFVAHRRSGRWSTDPSALRSPEQD